jgi:uncharacterized protein with PIN domain
MKHRSNISLFIRCYEELNAYLPRQKRKITFEHEFKPGDNIEQIIKSLHIPKDAVDLILVNGKSVDLHYRPRSGNRLSLYPVFESLDIRAITKVREKPLRTNRFILDQRLRRLGVYLRMAGFDVLYMDKSAEQNLIRYIKEEKRVYVVPEFEKKVNETTATNINTVDRVYHVNAGRPRHQFKQVLKRFDLAADISPWNRCIYCNGSLDRIGVESKKQGEFWACESCGQVYSKGFYYMHVMRFLAAIKRCLKLAA